MKKKLKKRVKKVLVRIVNSNNTLKYMCVRIWNMIGRARYRKKYMTKYPLDKKLVVFEAFGGRQYSCNPRALYEELLRNPKYRDYKKVWVFNDPELYSYLEEDPNTRVVEYKSPEYYKAFASARVWVSNFRLGNDLIPRDDQIYIQTWHGVPLKRLGFDIDAYSGYIGDWKELEYQYSTDAKRYSYVLSPSEFYKEKITSAFRLNVYGKKAVFIDGGYPRNDFLLRLTEEKIGELREKLDIPDGKKIILYAPTWRESENIPGEGYRFHLAVDFDKWREALGPDVLILYRSHYLVANYIDLTPYQGFVRNVSDWDDINELYAVSDLLVTDYSSVFFDYANLNRPIVFFMYDYDEYKYETRGFYISEEELPGPIVREEEELLDVLRTYSGEGYEEIYRAFNEKFNPYRQGNGSEIVWDTVL